MQQKIGLGARLLLGLMFVVFGMNFFVPFLPMPAPPESSAFFLGALFKSGYIFPIIKTIEVIAGLALLTGYFVPLALLFLAPIIINIALVHFILDTSGAPIAAALVILAAIVAWANWASYAHLFNPKS